MTGWSFLREVYARSIPTVSAVPRPRPRPGQYTLGFGNDAQVDEDLPAEFQAGPFSEGAVHEALRQIASGVPEEEAARSLTWKDFEGFCAQLMRACGYTVRENIYLSRPRAQIDLVASGPVFTISLDCKHWKRAASYASLEGFARNQVKRSRLLRKNLHDPKPIVSAILCLSEPMGNFVIGVAVVPLRTLRNFVETVESHSGLLEKA